ncbi:MAG: DNA adenine methylase [Deltaproteobacteria bacterium]|nr:DNA adenine methylase [Deltaproteobacteria bacterium]
MTVDYSKCPWPWFGGKTHAAPVVWEALGDVDHYIEPFAGSLAVLLRRPHPANRAYKSETVNDADGLLINFWRSVQLDPEATAEAASWPVAEADLHARHLALLRWKAEQPLERMMADPHWHDARMAGWWAWGQSSWLGTGWCSGRGPWVIGEDGRITKQGGGRGVSRQVPTLSNNGEGVNHAGTRAWGVGDPFHPMTMPELRAWLKFLSARLRHVRILNGDWSRAVSRGVILTRGVRDGGVAGIFLDPPYSHAAQRSDGLYAVDDKEVANEVREVARERAKDPRTRIVIAGFEGEHDSLVQDGWKVAEWYRRGYDTGGRGRQQHRERLWISPHCLQPRRQLGFDMVSM